MADGQGPLSLEQIALEEELGIRETPVGPPAPMPYPAAGPPAESVQVPPAVWQRFQRQLPKAAQWSPVAQAWVDPETQTVIPPGGGAGGAGGAGPIAEPYAGGGGAPAGGQQGTLEEHTEMRARAVLGDRGIREVQQLRARGIPEGTIRARLGMGETLPAGGAAPAAAAPRGGAGGGGYVAPSQLPPELQRQFETLYPADYESRVAAAAVAGEISNDQARQMMRGFAAWQQSPLGQRAKMFEQQVGLAEQAGELEQQQLAAEAEAQQAKQALLAQQRTQQEAEANAQRAWQEDYDREYQDQTARYERAMEEAKRAQIDPNRARIPIVDALAIALGQFAAILTGTPNAAIPLINKRLDDDIAAQDAAIKGLESQVAMRHNRLGLLRQKLGDRSLAQQAEKRLQLEQISTQLQQIATGATVETNRVGAEKLKLAIDAKIQGMRQQEDAFHADLAQRRAWALEDARQKAAIAQQQARSGMGPWQTGNADKMQGRYIPGFGFVANDVAAREVRENLGKFDTTIRAFESLLKIANVPGAATSPEMRARAESLLSQADLGLAVANQLGAISASDADFVQKQRGNPTALTDIGAKTRLEQTLGDLKANRSKALSRHHFVPGEMGTTMQRTKEGTVEPRLSYRLALPGASMQQPGASIPETEVGP